MFKVMHTLDKPLNQVEKYLDPQLWHACAGGMAQIPPLNCKVYYFPQGHAEHTIRKNIDFPEFPRIPPIIPCKVTSMKYLADSGTDEVYTKIILVPLRASECDSDDESGFLDFNKTEEKEKPNSFAKTLTQSDANNGGGFSVPRYCAETIFPKLDFASEPPVQTILVKDVHGLIWKFRHIYRGTPRRHLLTTGWSNFVNSKKLVAGDSVVFLRAENGDLCVGVRRAKTGICIGLEMPPGYSRGFSSGDEKNGDRFESIIKAVSLAASGRAFEVIYYPRASSPEFVVRASVVRASLRVQWCGGIRFKMAFETEDSSRISWFIGTISSVGVDDPVRWPNSPWRILQVSWDEPDLLQTVKRVNPWLVELVSDIPTIHLSPFAPPKKRPRQHLEFPLGQLPMPTLPNNLLSPNSPLCCFLGNISSRIQGTRHAQLILPPTVGPLRPFDFKQLGCSGGLSEFGNSFENYNIFTDNMEKNKEVESPVFVLFGRTILTEEQIISRSCSVDSDENRANLGNVSNGSGPAVIQNCLPEASSDEEVPRFEDRCEVFLESEDVSRILDLSVIGSYEELYGKLADMFGVERLEVLRNVVYIDGSGSNKRIGDEAFGFQDESEKANDCDGYRG
ncbi:hypothetical protein OROMI_010401 [Orobanche minor]